MTPWGGQVISSVLVYKSQRTIWSRAIWPEANWLSCQCGWNVEFINNKTFRLQCLYKDFFCSKGKFCLEWFSFLCFLFFSFPQWWRSKPRLRKLGEHTTVELHPPINFQPLMHLPASSSSFCSLFFLGFSLFSTPWYFSSLITCLELDWDGRNISNHRSKVGNKPNVHYSTSHLAPSRFTIPALMTDGSWLRVLNKTFQESVIKQTEDSATDNKVG